MQPVNFLATILLIQKVFKCEIFGLLNDVLKENRNEL